MLMTYLLTRPDYKIFVVEVGDNTSQKMLGMLEGLSMFLKKVAVP